MKPCPLCGKSDLSKFKIDTLQPKVYIIQCNECNLKLYQEYESSNMELNAEFKLMNKWNIRTGAIVSYEIHRDGSKNRREDYK